jgi:hypothetical protein
MWGGVVLGACCFVCTDDELRVWRVWVWVWGEVM